MPGEVIFNLKEELQEYQLISLDWMVAIYLQEFG